MPENPEPLSERELDELEYLYRRASGGEWRTAEGAPWQVVNDRGLLMRAESASADADAAFCVAARRYFLRLIALAREAVGE